MKYTLLEIVQLILQSMDSDEVNSIQDTVESNDIAHLVKSVYYDLAVDLNLPEHETLFELNASGTSTKPTLMTVPDNVTRLDWIKYNVQETGEDYENYQNVDRVPFNIFLERQTSLRNQTSGVGEMTITFNGETFNMMYETDRMPTCYTTVDDNTLIFDAYDSTEDSTLQKSKTMCSGVVYPVFTLSDSFVPDLDPTQFSYLINRAKYRAFAEKKQVQNAEAAGEARRQKILVQKRKRKVKDSREIYKVLSRWGK